MRNRSNGAPMQWSDEAIVLSARRMGENSGRIHLLTHEHGLHTGLDRGAFSKRQRGLYEPGNIIHARWQARLAEHMGMLNSEMVQPTASLLMDNRLALSLLNAATAMIERGLVERDPQPQIHEQMRVLIASLLHAQKAQWLMEYVRLEFSLLEHTGFGLDLSRCASTGQLHDLCYVSPRTGRAVGRTAGEPYHDRLLALPAFLLDANHTEASMEEYMQAIRLCGYFLIERLFMPRNITLPAARIRLVELLTTQQLPKALPTAEIVI